MGIFRVAKLSSRLGGGESGTTLLETLVALGLLGIIAVAFLSGLATTSQAGVIADEQATAESLARSQMEWAKEASYIDEATEYASLSIPSYQDYAGYNVTIAAEPLHNPDEGIQKLTVTVSHHNRELTKLEGYKVNR